MPKAARVLAALKRNGWVQTRQRGSHRRLVKNGLEGTFAFHNTKDLGRTLPNSLAILWKNCSVCCSRRGVLWICV